MGGGDDEEMVAFCRDHHPRLVGLLALQVGDRSIAEELAQDVLVAVCERWGSLDQPRAWANRVALNRASSWWRRRQAEWRANARHGPHPSTSTQQDPGEVLAVRELVAALPDRQRTALLYRYYASMTVAETAQSMRCAEGTVRALTHQAMSTLRDATGLLEQEEDADVR